MRTAFTSLAAALALASASKAKAQEINDRFLSVASKAAKTKSAKTSDAKADKMAATKGSTHSFIGFWTAIDTMDGSTLRLSISCDDAATTNECEVIFSDDYWGPSYCGGMGVVNQMYTLSSSGSLTADYNGPITCFDGKELTGYEDFNEYVLQSNGSLMWKFFEGEATVPVNQFRFWPTSRA